MGLHQESLSLAGHVDLTRWVKQSRWRPSTTVLQRSMSGSCSAAWVPQETSARRSALLASQREDNRGAAIVLLNDHEAVSRCGVVQLVNVDGIKWVAALQVE